LIIQPKFGNFIAILSYDSIEQCIIRLLNLVISLQLNKNLCSEVIEQIYARFSLVIDLFVINSNLCLVAVAYSFPLVIQ